MQVFFKFFLFCALAFGVLTSPTKALAKAVNPCRFIALKLGENYQGEHLGHSEALPGDKVRYFNKNQRKKYRVHFRSGLMMLPTYSGKLKLLTTKGQDLGESVLFSFDLQNNIYTNLQTIEGHTHHSTFTAGSDVWAAGTLQVHEGKLREITNSSGHYKPEWQNIYLFLRHLQSKGATFEQLVVRLHWIPRHLHSRIIQVFIKDFGLSPGQIHLNEDEPAGRRFHYQGSGGGGLWF